MTVKERYESAKEIYAKIGVDTDKAIETLKKAPVSLHCCQGSRQQETILELQEHQRNYLQIWTKQ